MSKHTPGPWVKDENYNLVGSNGERVVCSSNGLSFGSAASWPSAEANAHLIAAAPELLEALTDALCALEVCGKDYDYVMGKARRTIAKARGEA